MAFFKNFLKPKWQHENPDVRREAIADLDSTEQLLTFIQQESEAELRKLAVERISDEKTLDELCSHNQAEVRDTAQTLLLNLLLPEGKSIDDISDTRTLIRIAGLTSDHELRLAAIARLTDEDERLQIATTHAVAKVRLAAAEGIHDADRLHKLQHHAQGKDKAVYRLCKDRLTVYKAEQEAREAQNRKIEHIIQQAQQLNRLGYGPDFNGRLQVLNKQFAEFKDSMTADQATLLDQELTSATEILKQHEEEEQRLAESRSRAEAAEKTQADILERLSSLLETAISSQPEALQQQLQAMDQEWRDSQSDSKASGDALRQYENQHQQVLTIQACLAQFAEHQEALDTWLSAALPGDMKGLKQIIKNADEWQKRFKWPAEQDQPAWIGSIRERKQHASEALSELEGQQKSRIETIDQQIAKLESLLQEGHLKDASRLYGQLNAGLRQVDSRLVQSQQRHVRSLGGRLGEMRDWQGFVTIPKKESLCEAMEALIDADISPDVLADKIQVLQDEWKTLNSSQPDRELWQRFQTAGDKAFEPCRAYFAEVAEQRQKNVDLRNQLIEELTHYEAAFDWARADWKVVQKTLDAARETFRSYSPVDRGAHKDTQQRFHDICDRIYAHLKEEFDRNLDQKRALIERAEAEIETEVLADAIETVKELQQQWKDVGITPRNADQKLWKQFRQACDAVFNRLEQERAERKARIDNVVQQAEELLAEAEALVQPDTDYHDARSRLSELEQGFAELELPKSAHQRIRKGFGRVNDTLSNIQQAQQTAAEKARWQGLIDRLQALASGDENQWQQASDLPSGYSLAAFEQAWDKRSDDNSDSAEATDLCIQLEILAGIDSPATDKARRMELQVQRLAQGMGQATDLDNERVQLVGQWLNLTVSNAQTQRFSNAVEASIR